MFSLNTEVIHYLTTFVYDLHYRVVEVFLLYFVSLLERVMKRIKILKMGSPEDIPVAVWRCLEGREGSGLFNYIV